jgi:hypothetical protein
MKRLPNHEETPIIEDYFYKAWIFFHECQEYRMAHPIIWKCWNTVYIHEKKKGERAAWIDFFDNIHLMRDVVMKKDSFLFNVLIHELVHAKQKEKGINRYIIWLPFIRDKYEAEAYDIGVGAEIWFKNKYKS